MTFTLILLFTFVLLTSILQHFFHSFKPVQPAIIVEVIRSTPALLFTPLTLPTGPLQVFNVGHPVSFYTGRI